MDNVPDFLFIVFRDREVLGDRQEFVDQIVGTLFPELPNKGQILLVIDPKMPPSFDGKDPASYPFAFMTLLATMKRSGMGELDLEYKHNLAWSNYTDHLGGRGLVYAIFPLSFDAGGAREKNIFEAFLNRLKINARPSFAYASILTGLAVLAAWGLLNLAMPDTSPNASSIIGALFLGGMTALLLGAAGFYSKARGFSIGGMGIAILALILVLAVHPRGVDSQNLGGDHEDLTACFVTDLLGFEDTQWNAPIRDELEQFAETSSIKIRSYESHTTEEVTNNVRLAVSDGCSLIILAGSLMLEASEDAANTYPQQQFALISDFGSVNSSDNITIFQLDMTEAAFLAGFVAAGTTKTGTVATYAGMDIPPMTAAMDAFWAGVQEYNLEYGTGITVLGWDPQTRQGIFVGDFISTPRNISLAKTFTLGGADILFPVAGPGSQGAGMYCQDTASCWVIGYGTDGYDPAFADIWLTNVSSHPELAAVEAVRKMLEGSLDGGVIELGLTSNAVGLAPFGGLDRLVPDTVEKRLPELVQEIISGDIRITP